MDGAKLLIVEMLRPDPRQPGVVRVAIKDQGCFLVSAEAVERLALNQGAAVGAATLEELRRAAVRHEARTIALRLLRRRLRSRVEVETALRRRQIPVEAVLAVSAELRSAGWIDDARFARAWVNDRLSLHPRGPRRLRAELLAKGVATGLIDEAITALIPPTVEDDLAAAQARARVRRLRGLQPAVVRRRLAGWLQRRGYSGEVIARVLRTITLVAPDNDDVDPAA